MANRTRFYLSLLAVGVVGMGVYAYSVFATQGAGTLAQAPMNIQANIKPAFIMAVDDSGSMTFQTMFPGQDGEACWSDTAKSFFINGRLRTSADQTNQCDYFYVLPGPRIGGSYYGIPPLDTLGFARSPDFNPSYFNPDVTYEPWVNSDMSSYGNAALDATRIDPRNSGTVDLFSDIYDSSHTFRIRKGMRIPAGVNYYSGGWKTAGSGGVEWNSSTSDIYFRYKAATFFLKDNRTITGYTNLGKVEDACGAGCDMWKYEPATTEARQNFANWFSYYGNRNRAMVAGMTRAMADVRDMRVGYFTINGSKPSTLAMRDLTIQADKSALYTSMLSLAANGGTPNRIAVNYIGTQFMRTDKDAPIQSQCQKNSGMLFTDGYSNGSDPTPSVGAFTNLGVPFDPTPANSMAAIATKYYQTNLRADLPAGKVRIPEACSKVAAGSLEWKRLDCNNNLHMNFYGITLGARGKLFNPEVEQDPYTDSSIYGNWPAHVGNTPNTVDDIWHATVNTRGEYINARSPVDITDAMRRVLASAGGGSTPSGSLGLTGARIGDGSFTVAPSYTARNESTDWFSTLLAQTVTSDPITGQATYAKLWEATDPGKIPAASARDKVFWARNKTSGVRPAAEVFSASSGNLRVDDFCVDELKRCTKSGLKDGISGGNSRLKLSLDEIVAYLLGDQSKEVQNGGNLRDRSTRLGDIVNSTPVVDSPSLDHGYRSLRTKSGSTYSYPFKDDYKTFLESKKTADRPMVYAGANDGMLHAFDGKTGREVFAYIPVTALGHMGNLLFPYAAADKENQVFSHTYFVDGPVTVSDARIGGAWKTILVGTAGAGGRGVFALDVTRPDNFGAGNVLWEINDTVSNSGIGKDIGYVLGKPVVVPVLDGGGNAKWKVIFGNGYNSANKQAALFIVDADASSDSNVTRISAIESGQTAPNGLGNIIVLDRWIGNSSTSGRDGFADTVYGADQNGAIWKFDLRNNSKEVIFVARESNAGSAARQSILGGLEASVGPGGGVMLYFGTGSFSFDGDKTDTQLQTFYGIIDRPSRTGQIQRSQLLQQSITESSGERKLSGISIGAQPGWYVDLAVGSARKGERFVGYPRVESGVVFFTTYEPQSTADCAGDGFNRLYGVYALSGGSAMSAVRFSTPNGASPSAAANGFLLNTGGSAPVKDVAVLSTPRVSPLAPGATAAEQAAALAARCSMVIQVAGAPPMYMPRPCGRQSWRQVR